MLEQYLSMYPRLRGDDAAAQSNLTALGVTAPTWELTQTGVDRLQCCLTRAKTGLGQRIERSLRYVQMAV